MSTPTRPTPQSLPASLPQPTEDEIREYANHLFVLRGSEHGHHIDDWLEAEACLRACIPKESLRTRMHHHSRISEREALPLVKHGKA